MDASTGSRELQFVLGDLRIPAEVLTPEDWIKIWHHVLDKHKPHLKYLAGAKPLDHFINGDVFEYEMRRKTNLGNVRMSDIFPGFGKHISIKNIRCFWMTIANYSAGWITPEEEGKLERHVLLAQDGRLLLWTSEYFDDKNEKEWTRIAINAELHYLTDDDLVRWLIRYPDFIWMLLLKLYVLVKDDLDDKQKKLDHTVDFHRTIDGISGENGRVNWSQWPSRRKHLNEA